MTIEGPRRTPWPEWAVWSLMAGLYRAAGMAVLAEGAMVNIVGALAMEHLSSSMPGFRRGDS